MNFKEILINLPVDYPLLKLCHLLIMEELLTAYLGKPVALKDQAVIQISGYDMDYYECEAEDVQILIYRSNVNPVITKVIISQGKKEFNYALAQDKISVSHFLEFYLQSSALAERQLSLVLGKLEETATYLRAQALFYQMDRPENIRLVNILPQELKEAMRDYALLKSIIKVNQHKTLVRLFLDLNIDVSPEYEFLVELANSHKMRI